jgi:hypothetical protein
MQPTSLKRRLHYSTPKVLVVKRFVAIRCRRCDGSSWRQDDGIIGSSDFHVTIGLIHKVNQRLLGSKQTHSLTWVAERRQESRINVIIGALQDSVFRKASSRVYRARGNLKYISITARQGRDLPIEILGCLVGCNIMNCAVLVVVK